MQEDRPVRLEKELKNLSYQVRKIGVNINQVVAKINAGYGNQIDIYNLEKALEQAKVENKYVFVDCYTSWCGPCKMMAEKILPLKEVGEYMNGKFVCV